MTVASHRWAVLVATQHGKAAASGMSAEARLKEIRQLLSRAKFIADPLRTIALICGQFTDEWRQSAADLPPHNFLIRPMLESPLLGVQQALMAIRARETTSSVVLIPADHCAAVESAWVTGATEALRLASAHQDTVYLLHDKPQADPLPFAASTDMCSSTVVVGSTDLLLELCRGTRPTRLINLSTEEQPEIVDPITERATTGAQAQIHIVRIRSVDEYERLQRGQYARPTPTAIDVRV